MTGTARTDRDDLGRLERLHDVWRVGDQDLLVPARAEQLRNGPLTGRVQVQLRLVDRHHVGRTLGQVEQSHRHELAEPVGLLSDRHVPSVALEEHRHAAEHVLLRVGRRAQ